MKGFILVCIAFAVFSVFLSLPVFALDVNDFPTPHSQAGEPVEPYWNTIVQVCTLGWHFDPYWIAGIVKHESWFDANAENLGEKYACDQGFTGFPCPNPGRGLMQPTGPWVAGIPIPRLNEYQWNMPVQAIRSEAPVMNDPFIPAENLDRSCWYLHALQLRYNNDLELATLAYRHGFFGVDYTGRNVGVDYLNEVLQYRREYLASANVTEEALQSLMTQLTGDPSSGNPDDGTPGNPSDANNPVDANNPLDTNNPLDVNALADNNFPLPLDGNIPIIVISASEFTPTDLNIPKPKPIEEPVPVPVSKIPDIPLPENPNGSMLSDLPNSLPAHEPDFLETTKYAVIGGFNLLVPFNFTTVIQYTVLDFANVNWQNEELARKQSVIQH